MQIIMTPKEVDLLSSFLACTDHYFEFGMGGSTCLANSLVRKSIFSIESDKAWIDKVRAEVSASTISITLKHIDIGPTGGWGTPVSREREHLFPNYSRALSEADKSKTDFCLVDGRFRVACATRALSTLRSDAVVAIHDYNVRPQYHLIEEFARKIASCDTLALFVRRPDANNKHMNDIITMHEKNWE